MIAGKQEGKERAEEAVSSRGGFWRGRSNQSGLKNFSFLIWLHWVFIAVCQLSLVAATGATLAVGLPGFSLRGFSCSRAQSLGPRASAVVALRH